MSEASQSGSSGTDHERRLDEAVAHYMELLAQGRFAEIDRTGSRSIPICVRSLSSFLKIWIA